MQNQVVPVSRSGGHDLNSLDRGPLDDASCQISLVPVVLKKIFEGFPYIFLCEVHPGRSHFHSGVHDLNNLGRGPLDSSCQMSKLFVFWF